MRASLRVGAALLVATSGCGMTSTVTTQRRVLRRFEERVELPGELALSVSDEGSTARVTVERRRACATRQRVEGVDDVTTALSPEDPRTTATVAVGGLLSALAGVGLIGAPSLTSAGSAMDPGELSRGESIGLGAGLIGLGALLAVPWIYTTVRAGSTTQERPFQEQEPGGVTVACGTAPARGVVVLRVNGRALHERVSDPSGRVDLDLAALLPTEVLRGRPDGAVVELAVQESGFATRVDVTPYRRAVADADWARVESADAPEPLERFVIDHPDDRRVGEARRRAESLRGSDAVLARDDERSARWTAAGSDASRLAAFVAENVADVWDAEATCRAALQPTEVEAIRAQVTACREHLEALPRRVGAAHPDVLADARRELAEAEQRLAESEQAQRESEARAAELHARARRRSRDALRGALGEVRGILDGCRSGRATGPSAARAAYQALARARQNDGGAQVGRLAVRVAASCRCTPACAGVPAP